MLSTLYAAILMPCGNRIFQVNRKKSNQVFGIQKRGRNKHGKVASKLNLKHLHLVKFDGMGKITFAKFTPWHFKNFG